MTHRSAFRRLPALAGRAGLGQLLVPFRKVQHWSWEIFWSVGGLFSWVLAPWLFAYFRTNDLLGVLSATPSSVWFWCFLFGLLWGFGGLTFGLTMRYLGLVAGHGDHHGPDRHLRHADAAALFPAKLLFTLIWTANGQIILLGLVVCLAGIAVIGRAGRARERELPAEVQRASIIEFDLRKGVMVAIFSGVMLGLFRLRAGGGASRCASLRWRPAPRPCGRACQCCASCCWAERRPTLSGAPS